MIGSSLPPSSEGFKNPLIGNERNRSTIYSTEVWQRLSVVKLTTSICFWNRSLMEPEIPIFKPRYTLRVRLIMLLPTLLFFGILCNVAFSIAPFPTVFWLLVFILGTFISLVPFFFIREIRFPDEMVVRRHFLPDLFFSYKDFEQINSDSIQAGGQSIRMGTFTNLDELKEMSRQWKAAKILKESKRISPKTETLFLQRGYGTYAGFWGLMFGIIVMQMNLPWLQLDPRWVLGGTFLLVYLIYSYIVPKFL